MHKIILALFVAAFHLSAVADIPDCWNVDPNNYKRGSYTILVEASQMTGIELASIFEELNGSHFAAQRFPIAMDGTLFLWADANPESSQKQVETAVRGLAKRPGVKVSCVTLYHPMRLRD
jgi:hypothetical protein